MRSKTLENIKRDTEQDNLYNLFTQTYIDVINIGTRETTVTSSENMRLDLVSNRIFGSYNYIEELMQINNILNIWNIKSGDKIKYTNVNNLSLLYDLEQEFDDIVDELVKPNKNTRIDPDRITQVPPTIKPRSMQNLTIDKKARKIKISGNIS